MWMVLAYKFLKNFYKGKFENYFLDDEILINFVLRSKKI